MGLDFLRGIAGGAQNAWGSVSGAAGNLWGRVRSGYDSPMRTGGGAPEGYSTQYGGVAPVEAYGLPGYEQYQQGMQQFAADRGGGPFRGQQETLAQMLMQQAQGKNSFAAEQLRQDTARLQAMQQSAAAGARPSQSAMATRLASQNMGNIGANMAGQSQLAQIQERNAAAGALGNVLQGARGQDLESYLRAQQLALEAGKAQQYGGLMREQIRADRYGTAMQAPTKREALYGVLQGLGSTFAGMG